LGIGIGRLQVRITLQHGQLLQKSQHHGRLLAVVRYWCGKIFDRCFVQHRRTIAFVQSTDDATSRRVSGAGLVIDALIDNYRNEAYAYESDDPDFDSDCADLGSGKRDRCCDVVPRATVSRPRPAALALNLAR
jgi:hypothetical protein